METMEIETLEGESFNAFIAEPDGTPRGAIIVIQEIFGVNEGIRRKCGRWAELGYIGIAPDLFWRLRPGVELDPDIAEEFKEALDLMGKFDQDLGVKDIEATIRAVRALLPEDGKVGCVGYCLGGRLAYMTAARTDIEASVGYYAVGLDNILGEKSAISNPLMLHIAGDDGFVDKEVQRKMHEGLDAHPQVTLHNYPGEGHGFAAEMGKRRSEEAARLADSRTEEFFTRHIG
jgi:carboxymethylenebutenolidase